MVSNLHTKWSEDFFFYSLAIFCLYVDEKHWTFPVLEGILSECQWPVAWYLVFCNKGRRRHGSYLHHPLPSSSLQGWQGNLQCYQIFYLENGMKQHFTSEKFYEDEIYVTWKLRLTILYNCCEISKYSLPPFILPLPNIIPF